MDYNCPLCGPIFDVQNELAEENKRLKEWIEVSPHHPFCLSQSTGLNWLNCNCGRNKHLGETK